MENQDLLPLVQLRKKTEGESRGKVSSRSPVQGSRVTEFNCAVGLGAQPDDYKTLTNDQQFTARPEVILGQATD